MLHPGTVRHLPEMENLLSDRQPCLADVFSRLLFDSMVTEQWEYVRYSFLLFFGCWSVTLKLSSFAETFP